MDELKILRRKLHTMPEPGWCEFKTTAFLISFLKNLKGEIRLAKEYINKDFIQGRDEKELNYFLKKAEEANINPKLLASLEGYTGCIWELRGELFKKDCPTIACRFDIDCVCVSESEKSSHFPVKNNFTSTHLGYMHSCAHDGHMAIGLKLASFLSSKKARLKARYLLIFQAAEEGVRGAMSIAKSELFKEVDYFLAAHLSLCAKSGELVLNPQNFLATIKYEAKFKGKASHAGNAPEKGANALAAATFAVNALLSLPRHSAGASRVNVGYIRAGRANNVIPDDAVIGFELRGASDEICEFLDKRALKILKACASMQEVKLTLKVNGRAFTLKNDDFLISLLKKAADITYKGKKLKIIAKRDFNASEDASCFFKALNKEKKAKGLYFIIGANRVGEHHQALFDFDEDAMNTGLELFKALLLKLEEKL